jgi:hypothetical protein
VVVRRSADAALVSVLAFGKPMAKDVEFFYDNWDLRYPDSTNVRTF